MFQKWILRALFYALVPALFWFGVRVLAMDAMVVALKIFIFLATTDALVTWSRRQSSK